MRTLLISDLHLQQQRPDITRALFCLLDQFYGEIDQLFILGDFFELWLGDDYLPEPSVMVSERLKQLNDAGCQIYIMHGNRDFLIGKSFAEKCGGILIHEPYMTQLGGKPCLLMHGDHLCTADTDYLEFRNMVRNPSWQQRFLNQPVEERIRFAQQARSESQTATTYKPEDIMDVTPSEVLKYFDQYQMDILIHGHTHRPDTHEMVTSGGVKTRIVLGDWNTRGWYALAERGEIKLNSFAFPD